MKKLFMALLGLSLCLGFTACGDDDDKGSSATPEPTITTAAGDILKLYSAPYGYWYEYDDKGKLTSFSDVDNTWYVQGNAFTIKDEDGDMTFSFTFNSAGLISSCKGTVSSEDEDGYEKGTVSYDFSYNSKKQCTSAKLTYSGEWSDEYGTGKENGTGTMTYSWQNDNLVKAVHNDKCVYQEIDGRVVEKTIENGRETFEYTYSDLRNPLLQMPLCIAEVVPFDYVIVLDALSLLGLGGVGPAYFPSKVIYTEEYWEDGEEPSSYSDSYSFTFVLNGDGTIASENGQSYSYSSTDGSEYYSPAKRLASSLRENFNKRHHKFTRSKFRKK